MNILEKIRKILSKTVEAGCTEDEATNAYQLAARLMRDNNITEADLETSEYVEGDGGEFGTWTYKNDFAFATIKNHYFVEPFLSAVPKNGRTYQKLVIFGTPKDVERARFVYKELLSAYERLFSLYKKGGAPSSEKRAFILGVHLGYHDRLREENSKSPTNQLRIEREMFSLVRRSNAARTNDAFSERIAQRKGTMIEKKRDAFKVEGSVDALNHGYAAGRNLNILYGVENSPQNCLETS